MPAIEPETAQAAQTDVRTAQQTEHLLIVSIGPVQDFIAAARKCQDLWFGSFLLSELATERAQGLRARHQRSQRRLHGARMWIVSLDLARCFGRCADDAVVLRRAANGASIGDNGSARC